MLPKKYARKPKETFKEWLVRNLWMAYLDARKGKRSTGDEFKFEANAIENILILADDILERVYHPSPGIAFVVHDPVVREIFAAPFRDRVVHHFLYNCVAEWWDKRLIYDTYSCRVGKGGLLGVNRLRQNENRALHEFKEEVYIIKLDIQGYFMSLPRKELYKRVVWGLKRQFKKSDKAKSDELKSGEPKLGRAYPREYYVLKYLWKEIIFDDPTKGVLMRATEGERRKLPNTKTLFSQPKGYGIVIGNLSSQLLSNIYLDTLDRFMKYTLKYKYYGRYVDDFYFLVPESKLDQALNDIETVRTLLRGMHLTLHPHKIYIQNIKKGVTFLGSRVYPNRVLPGPRVIKNYRKAVYEFATGHGDTASIVSYMGHLKHTKGELIQQKIFKGVGWDWAF